MTKDKIIKSLYTKFFKGVLSKKELQKELKQNNITNEDLKQYTRNNSAKGVQ